MNAPLPPDANAVAARRLVVSGRVQGVGFRPFVYRLAAEHEICGWVRNHTGTVVIHAEGRRAALAAFARELTEKAPPLARPRLDSSKTEAPQGHAEFSILPSVAADRADIHLPPDLFCCEDCLREMRDPRERRFGYAFTNCTQCGPRYTIVDSLPYDRARTAMAGFALCERCRAEYENPLDRRYHAQPLACPDCGPALSFVRADRIVRGHEALTASVACLRAGEIVAVKGVGGYHLLCDAADSGAVQRLRARKHRPDKPLAVMAPVAGEDGLAGLRAYVQLSDEEGEALRSPERPIVLARLRPEAGLSPALAPRLAELGVFLPYSPLHHLLLEAFDAPLVATSGNLSGEPVICDPAEATQRLGAVADAFLHHDRPILRPADDSVMRRIAGRARPLRLGRGAAPIEIELPFPLREPTLAVGAQAKSTVALGWGRRAVVSPHIGDLDSLRSREMFAQIIADLQRLYAVEATRAVRDLHPGYASTRWLAQTSLPSVPVQHHRAHAGALAAEHPDVARWLMFAWDGVGLGDDGTSWGGETFHGAAGAWTRIASLRPFRLLGGDKAAREPWRAAAALAWECGRTFAAPNALAEAAWAKGIGTIATTSAGRLFDAASALVLGIERTSYEGQGPMALEAIAADDAQAIALPVRRGDGVLCIDWEPLLTMLADARLAASERAGIFHASLAEAVAELAGSLACERPYDAVGLTGGVFQNRRLAEAVIARLGARGVAAFLPARLPANDGGLAFGQLYEIMASDRAAQEAQA